MTRVCHLSSVHRHDDVRIFLKQCRTLAKAGYETHFVVPGASDGIREGVHFHGIDSAAGGGRMRRMTAVAGAVYVRARAVRADIYHFHDPELLPAGLLLAAEGKRVIYDAHEHVLEDLRSKDWIPPNLRAGVATAFRYLEQFGVKRLAAVSAATPHIGEHYAGMARRVAVVNNFPFRNEFQNPAEQPWSGKERAVCYTGLMSVERGLFDMLASIAKGSIKLILAGNFGPPSLLGEAERMAGWKLTEFLGQVTRTEVNRAFQRSMAGLVLFHSIPNHVNAQPNKLFEYMSAGIPVIASNFPLWREIVEGNRCGLVVDPTNVDAIASAISKLVDNPKLAKELGQNGRRAVLDRYNWENDGASALLNLYKELC